MLQLSNDRQEIRRADGRVWNEMRHVTIRRGFTQYAEGSVLIEVGHTRVICNATVEERVPDFLAGLGKGWVTAEYAMLPRATNTRIPRAATGRTYEIQRLIGRTLRSVTDLSLLGTRTIQIDCDVIQADGGTRTAAITGSFVALYDAVTRLLDSNGVTSMPIKEFAAATSVGIVGGVAMLDLSHEEDSRAEVDLNVIMTQDGKLIEIQGTAEKGPFARKVLDELLNLSHEGIQKLIKSQMTALGSAKL